VRGSFIPIVFGISFGNRSNPVKTKSFRVAILWEIIVQTTHPRQYSRKGKLPLYVPPSPRFQLFLKTVRPMNQKSFDRKSLLLISGGLVVVLFLLQFVINPPSSTRTDGASGAPAQVATADRDRDFKPGKFPMKVAHGDASRRVITHQAADFARGEQDNVVVKDGLQMGDDPTFVYELEPGKVFGVYLSPEEKALEPFDTFIASSEVTTPENSVLNWAFRIKLESGDWSDWRELSAAELNQPVRLGDLASSWQYRLSFYANSAAASPHVHRVTVTTLRFEPAQLSMNSSPSFPQTTPPRHKQ
jgi:hypothetical protein